MSYDVHYRIDLPDHDLLAALAMARRLARGSNAQSCSAVVVTESADHASAFASLRPGALVVPKEPWLDGGPEYTVELTDVDDVVIDALLAAAGDDGFSLSWSCSRFWHDAWLGRITLDYNCSREHLFWFLEPRKLEIRVHAFLDHWPEAEARKVFAELAGAVLERVHNE